MERDEVSKDEERVARSYALVPFLKQSINHMRECQTRDELKGLDFLSSRSHVSSFHQALNLRTLSFMLSIAPARKRNLTIKVENTR